MSQDQDDDDSSGECVDESSNQTVIRLYMMILDETGSNRRELRCYDAVALFCIIWTAYQNQVEARDPETLAYFTDVQKRRVMNLQMALSPTEQHRIKEYQSYYHESRTQHMRQMEEYILHATQIEEQRQRQEQHAQRAHDQPTYFMHAPPSEFDECDVNYNDGNMSDDEDDT